MTFHTGRKSRNYRLKNGRRLISVVLVFAAALLALCAVTRTEVNAQDSAELLRIVVRPGDTLWDIAGEYGRGGQIDIRRFIHQIRKTNNLMTSDLTPGQVLYIPGK
ncbi:MAG: cell division suppressor protein YneA [bacterium]|jgi:hypothetical protein